MLVELQKVLPHSQYQPSDIDSESLPEGSNSSDEDDDQSLSLPNEITAAYSCDKPPKLRCPHADCIQEKKKKRKKEVLATKSSLNRHYTTRKSTSEHHMARN